MTKEIGTAYGFFQCKAPKQEILDLLPLIRSKSNSPSALELTLYDSSEIERIAKGDIPKDEDARYVASEAVEFGMPNNYMLEARLPEAESASTAEEVKTILNTTYASALYQRGELYNKSIVYREKDEFFIID